MNSKINLFPSEITAGTKYFCPDFFRVRRFRLKNGCQYQQLIINQNLIQKDFF